MLKENLRLFIRRLIKARESETIHNAINRKSVSIKKKFLKKQISSADLHTALLSLGINKGDNLMVHASWREFYNYLGKPEEIIEFLKEIIGDEGTLLMPSYGKDRTFFDVNNTPSNAGVLSEIFRLQSDTYRSACTHFSICAWGKNAYTLTNRHFFSEYGFDSNSPYYLFTQLKNSKVLFLGLGKEPTQISLFHCAGYILKDTLAVYSKLLSHKYKSLLIKDGITYKKEMLIRLPGHKNNNRVFKRIFRSIKGKKHVRVSNLDFVIIDAQEGLQKAIEHGKNGQYCYSKMHRLS